MIKITYKDKDSWVDINGVDTDWTNYAIKYKDDRIQPSFMSPEIITDQWNGKESDIQHIRHDYYYCEFSVKESEKKSLSQIKSCSDIIIVDYEMNDSDTVINQTYTLDTTKSDYVEIDEIEPNVGQTSGARYSIKFRTNRTVINKGFPVDNTNYIGFGTTQGFYENGSTITNENNSLIARLDDNKIVTYNGTLHTYIRKGNKFVKLNETTGSFNFTAICGMRSNRIVVVEANDDIIAYDLINGTWTQTGSALNVSGIAVSTRICRLDDDNVVICAQSTVNGFQTYYFNGSTWSAIGNLLSIGSVSAPRVASVDSNTISYFDSTNDELREYNYISPNWTLGTSTLLSPNGVGYITNIGEDVVYYDDNLALTKYVLDTSWVAQSGTATLAAANNEFIGLDSDEIVLAQTNEYELLIYKYGYQRYYTDYEIIDYTKDIDDIYVDWSDGSTKLMQTKYELGNQMIFYLHTSVVDEFIKQIKLSDTYYFNPVQVYNPEIEKAPIGEDLWRVVVSAKRENSYNTVYQFPTSGNDLEITISTSTTNFYTDFDVELISESPEIDVVKNQTGINTKSKSITKTVKQVKFYLNETNAFDLKSKFEIFDSATLNSETVYEVREVSPEKIGVDLYEVTVNCLTGANSN